MIKYIGIIAITMILAVFIASCTTQTPSEQTADRTIVSNDPAECALVKFMCVEGMKPWFSEEGCGCEKINENENITVEEPMPESEMTLCAATSWMEGACTMEYRPVCGWFDESVQCITYPCAQTFSNPCMACTNEQVKGWTEGECPSS